MPASVPNRLTDREVEAYCGEFLAPVTLYIGRKLGPEAADLTGGCLLQALRNYDKSRTALASLPSWVRSKTRYLVIEALRSQDGRKGGYKYAARAAQTTLEDFDALPEQPHVGEALEAEESLLSALRKAAGAGRLQRWLILGRLYDFTVKDIQESTDVSPDKIYKEAAHLRQLLAAG